MTTDVPAPVLSIRDLRVTYRSRDDRIPAVRGVSLDLAPGEVLALVGESASGKSTVALTILGLLPDGAEVAGAVTYHGRALTSMSGEELRQLRGNEAGDRQVPNAEVLQWMTPFGDSLILTKGN